MIFSVRGFLDFRQVDGAAFIRALRYGALRKIPLCIFQKILLNRITFISPIAAYDLIAIGVVLNIGLAVIYIGKRKPVFTISVKAGNEISAFAFGIDLL